MLHLVVLTLGFVLMAVLRAIAAHCSVPLHSSAGIAVLCSFMQLF
jgi:hypothetical protein